MMFVTLFALRVTLGPSRFQGSKVGIQRRSISQLDRLGNWEAVQIKSSLPERHIGIPELFSIQ